MHCSRLATRPDIGARKTFKPWLSLTAIHRVLILVVALFPCAVAAEDILKIGAATSIENEVEGRLGTSSQKLAVGSEVFQNQFVRTGKESSAGLRFLDETNLSLSPSTEIKLDRYLYEPNKKSGTVVLDVPKGVVRFVTGTLDSKSYSIRTSLVTIGVRGTTFDVLAWPDRVTVLLIAGAVDLTIRSRRVYSLDQPNSAITIYRDGRINGPRNWNGTVTNFASLNMPAGQREGALKRTQDQASTPAPAGKAVRVNSSSGGNSAMDILGGNNSLHGVSGNSGSAAPSGGGRPKITTTTTTYETKVNSGGARVTTPTVRSPSNTTIDYGGCGSCGQPEKFRAPK